MTTVDKHALFRMMKKDLPEEAIDFEKAVTGWWGDYPDASEYCYAMQEWIKKWFGDIIDENGERT